MTMSHCQMFILKLITTVFRIHFTCMYYMYCVSTVIKILSSRSELELELLQLPGPMYNVMTLYNVIMYNVMYMQLSLSLINNMLCNAAGTALCRVAAHWASAMDARSSI